MGREELSTRTPLLFLSDVGEETGHVIGPLYWQLVKFDTVSLYILQMNKSNLGDIGANHHSASELGAGDGLYVATPRLRRYHKMS